MAAASFNNDDLPQDVEFDNNFTYAWVKENEKPVYSIEHYIVQWSIENFSLLMEKDHRPIVSPVFLLDFSKTEWLLYWNPNIFRRGQKSSLFRIRRYRDDNGMTSVGITFRFGVSKADNTTFWFNERKVRDVKRNDDVGYLITGIEELEVLTKSASPENDVVVISCEMYICHQVLRGIFKLTAADYDLVNLSHDFTKLIRAKESSDYCIKIPHWDIVTHKAILIARSSYFEEIIADDVESTYVELSDVSFDNITSLLLFMYSANFNLVAQNGPPDIGFYECSQRFHVTELTKLLTPKQLRMKTTLRHVELEFTWHIENFSRLLTGTNNSIVSPPFGTSSVDSPQWTLTIHALKSFKKISGFHIVVKADKEFDVLLSNVTLSLLDRNDAMQNERTIERSYSAGEFRFSNFLTQFPVHGFLQNDTLKIRCLLKFVVSSDLFESHYLFRSNCTAISLFKDLSDNLRRIFESSMLCDVALKKNISFLEAHKSILYARSRTFATKFLYSKIKDYILSVEDTDMELLRYIVNHAYTGILLEISTRNMVPLLRLAQQYCFRSSSMALVELARHKISHENFYELVKMASKMNATNLLHSCALFARKNAKQITESPEFRRLKQEAKGVYDFIFARISVIRRN